MLYWIPCMIYMPCMHTSGSRDIWYTCSKGIQRCRPAYMVSIPTHYWVRVDILRRLLGVCIQGHGVLPLVPVFHGMGYNDPCIISGIL